MTEVDNAFVKRGLWTDWSQGPVMGGTITTDIRTGTILVSILAIFSTLATTHLWHLCIFVTHQVRAHGRPSDGLFWQQQAILRTLPMPSTLMADNLALWWSWRKKADRAFVRCVLPVLIPLLFATATMVATIATNFVVDNDNLEVLVQSPLCGRANFTAVGADYRGKIIDLSVTYLRDCYTEGSSPAATCNNTFVQPRLPFTTVPSECPFDSSICSRNPEGPTSTITMDTGLLDMAEDFGINLGKNDAVKYRKKTTCSVLNLENYTQVLNLTEELKPDDTTKFGYFIYPGEQVAVISLGPSIDETINGFEENATFTYKYRQFDYLTLKALSVIGNADPQTTGQIAWKPIEELKLDNADTTLTLLGLNGAHYLSPVDDPVFSAHKKLTVQLFREDTELYFSDYPTSGIGCMEQYQFCITDPSGKEICSDLTYHRSQVPDAEIPGASPVQVAAIELLTSVNEVMNMPFGLPLGTDISTTNYPLASLPDNQWIVETKRWHSGVLAGTQIAMADYAMGPEARSPDAKDGVIKPKTEGQKQLCSAQKMAKAGGFANVNLFGFVFIITIACVLVTIDLTLLKILVFLGRFRKALAPRLDRWVQDGILQLQRRGFQSEGKGIWEHQNDGVPVTTSNVKLGELSSVTSLGVIEILAGERRGQGSSESSTVGSPGSDDNLKKGMRPVRCDTGSSSESSISRAVPPLPRYETYPPEKRPEGS